MSKHKHKAAQLPRTASSPETMPRTIAFYLPQFHPIPENDAWWGKGFTEWTNVTRAEPAFDGHYQPRRPADLGYYDLRVPEVMNQQAELARQYGIHGFCYYYYWFAGRRLLEKPLDRMLESGAPDFPFCLCWANENWSRRWDGSEQEVLMKQEYGPEYARRIIRDMLPFLQDSRYITIDGKPLLLVYRIDIIPDCAAMTDIWREEAAAAGLPGLYLVRVESFVEVDPREHGFDAVCEFPPHLMESVALASHEITPNLKNEFAGAVFDYSKVANHYGHKPAPAYKRFKGVVPSWDNTARKKLNAYVIARSSPDLYQTWLTQCLRETMKRFKGDERLVFINAWNEWAEGCYLEPDQKFGHQYLEATRDAQATVAAEASTSLNLAGLGKMDFAVALFTSGQLAEAYEAFIEVINVEQKNPLALVYLGLIALANELSDDAQNFFNHAIEFSADRANTQAAIGQRCMEAKEWFFAEHYLAAAIQSNPRLLGAHALLADAREQQGRPYDALQGLASLKSLSSTEASPILARLIRLAHELGDVEAEYKACAQAVAFPDSYARAIALSSYLDELGDAQQKEHVRNFASRYMPADPRKLAAGARQRLKVGFVVGKLDASVVPYRLEPILRKLDASCFQTIILAREASVGEIVQRIFLLADQWIPTGGLDAAQTDQLIREQGIDILINLDGFNSLSALEPFSRRSAPLQLDWGTTTLAGSLPCMDYSIRSTNDATNDTSSNEVIINTPTAWVFPTLPARLASRNNRPFTFACMVPIDRISMQTWQALASILGSTPGTCLQLNAGATSELARQHVLTRFGDSGIEAHRLKWVQALDTCAMHDAWREADVGLCPLTGNNAYETLLGSWAGVASIAANHGAPWSRAAADALAGLQLHNLIARDADHYVELACRASQDAVWLAAESAGLHARTAASPVNDAAGFAAAFGDTLISLWKKQGGSMEGRT